VSSWKQFFFENEEIRQADVNNDIVKNEKIDFISEVKISQHDQNQEHISQIIVITENEK
jgi:hypothetical protein